MFKSVYIDSTDIPLEGEYLVTIGRTTYKIGTLYQIASVKKSPTKPNRYYLKVLVAKDLLHLVTNTGFHAFLNGERIRSVVWYKRKKN